MYEKYPLCENDGTDLKKKIKIKGLKLKRSLKLYPLE